MRDKLGVLHALSYLIHLLELIFPSNLQSLFEGLCTQNVAHLVEQFFTKLHGTSTHLYESSSSLVLDDLVNVIPRTRTRNSFIDADIIS